MIKTLLEEKAIRLIDEIMRYMYFTCGIKMYKHKEDAYE